MAHPRSMLVAAFAALVLLLPVATAQVGVFGTTVKVGDSDYTPLLKTSTSLPLTIYRSSMELRDDVDDDCIIVGTGAPEDAPIKYLRLTPCFGKPAGSQIVGTDPEKLRFAEFVLQPVARIATRYADLNANSKYDAAEPVYIAFFPGTDPILHPIPSTGVPATKVAGASGVAGAWALRILPAFGHEAATFVRTTDDEIDTWETAIRSQAFSLAEREDKGWYMIPSASGTTTKNTMVPVKSVRIGIQGRVALQPLIQPSALELPSESPVAGEEYKFTVRYSNDGATAGPGLLVTRVNGAIVDARLTPWLNPGQAAAQLINVDVARGGPMKLDVNGYKVTLQATGDAAETPDATAALEARIAALEARLAEAPAPATAKNASVQAAPGPMAFTVLALLVLGALAIRRRAA